MEIPTLIYCAGNNKRLAKIAIDVGFKFGARLPCSAQFPVYFADQDWKKPNRKSYMKAVAKHKPYMATVLDWEREDQFKEVMDWAEEIAQIVEKVLIIPKVLGSIERIPEQVSGKDIVIAYSVPTKYGGTPIPFLEFSGRQIHLLGGSPYKQIITYEYMSQIADVISIDGNYYQMKAMRFCEHWEYPNKWIPDGGKNLIDAPYKAFEQSCKK